MRVARLGTADAADAEAAAAGAAARPVVPRLGPVAQNDGLPLLALLQQPQHVRIGHVETRLALQSDKKTTPKFKKKTHTSDSHRA